MTSVVRPLRAQCWTLAVCLAAAPGLAAAQARLPSIPASPTSRALDQIRDSSMRPLPAAPPVEIPRSDRAWVPDRFVTIPGTPGQVHIPAHWERRLPDGDFYVPPLTGVAPDGRTILVPAGRYPPADQRITP